MIIALVLVPWATVPYTRPIEDATEYLEVIDYASANPVAGEYFTLQRYEFRVKYDRHTFFCTAADLPRAARFMEKTYAAL
jgi:hypothetical protein